MHSLIELAAMLEHDPIYNGLPATVTAAADTDEPGWLSKVDAELRGKRAELNRLTWQKIVAGKEYQRLVEHLEPSKRKRFKARWENRQYPDGTPLDDPFEALVALWCALGLKSHNPDGRGEERELPFNQLIQEWPLLERQKGTITDTSRQVIDETLLAFLHRYNCPLPFALQNNALPPTPQQVPIHSAILEKKRTESLAYIELGIFLRLLKFAEPENDPYDLVLFWLRNNPAALDIRAFHPRWPTSNEISYSDVQTALSRARASDKLPNKATEVTVKMGDGHDCAAPVRHLLISRECIAGVYAGLGRSTFPWPTDPAMPADTDWNWFPVGVSQSKSYRTFILESLIGHMDDSDLEQAAGRPLWTALETAGYLLSTSPADIAQIEVYYDLTAAPDNPADRKSADSFPPIVDKLRKYRRKIHDAMLAGDIEAKPDPDNSQLKAKPYNILLWACRHGFIVQDVFWDFFELALVDTDTSRQGKLHPQAIDAAIGQKKRNKKKRHEQEKLFFDKIYQSAEQQGMSFALHGKRDPLPYHSEALYDVFCSFFYTPPRNHKGAQNKVSLATFRDNDLPELKIKLAPGRKSNKNIDIQHLIDLLRLSR